MRLVPFRTLWSWTPWTVHVSLAPAVLLCALLSACATGGGFGSSGGPVAQQPGIGGTGDVAQSPGIGGTGHVAQGSPGIGGTGIIGTVTGFGSIFVNGFEIDYPSGFSVSEDGAATIADALRVGQVVEVEASGSGTKLAARSISIRHEVVGPVEHVDAAAGRISILGQRITVAGPLAGGGDALRIADVAPGQFIAVSGLRRGDQSIAATRIDRTREGAHAIVRGPVSSADAQGFSILGLRIDAPAGSRAAEIAVGREVSISGSVNGGRLVPDRIQAAPARPFGGRVQYLSVEGYLARQGSGPLGLGRVPLTRVAPGGGARLGDRVIMEGQVDGRGWLVPEAAARRGAGGAEAPPAPQLIPTPDDGRSIPRVEPRPSQRYEQLPPQQRRR
ncbi:MAG: DUF5666 domain-containing protein [Pseudomonadota bacterium]|nr:DUF5666 domain-containing protein [Pseudomonadota bacterium]